MDAWSTVAGMRAMENICSISQKLEQIHDEQPTLRDYFAAQFMNGFCSNLSSHINSEDAEKFARMAYMMADKMLKVKEE